MHRRPSRRHATAVPAGGPPTGWRGGRRESGTRPPGRPTGVRTTARRRRSERRPRSASCPGSTVPPCAGRGPRGARTASPGVADSPAGPAGPDRAVHRAARGASRACPRDYPPLLVQAAWGRQARSPALEDGRVGASASRQIDGRTDRRSGDRGAKGNPVSTPGAQRQRTNGADGQRRPVHRTAFTSGFPAGSEAEALADPLRRAPEGRARIHQAIARTAGRKGNHPVDRPGP